MSRSVVCVDTSSECWCVIGDISTCKCSRVTVDMSSGVSVFQEKLRRRKLLEVAPRRTSGRLEVKRHMKVELEEKYRELGGATVCDLVRCTWGCYSM